MSFCVAVVSGTFTLDFEVTAHPCYPMFLCRALETFRIRLLRKHDTSTVGLIYFKGGFFESISALQEQRQQIFKACCSDWGQAQWAAGGFRVVVSFFPFLSIFSCYCFSDTHKLPHFLPFSTLCYFYFHCVVFFCLFCFVCFSVEVSVFKFSKDFQVFWILCGVAGSIL